MVSNHSSDLLIFSKKIKHLHTLDEESRQKSTTQMGDEAKEILKPIRDGSKDLLKNYGFEKEYFEGESYDIDDPRIIYLAFTIMKIEQLKHQENSFSEILINMCVETAYAGPIWDCIKRAAGIEFTLKFIGTLNF